VQFLALGIVTMGILSEGNLDTQGDRKRRQVTTRIAAVFRQATVVRFSRVALAAEILGQRGGRALHRIGVGPWVVMAAAVYETMLRIRIAD
jgi:hypothetical protein